MRAAWMLAASAIASWAAAQDTFLGTKAEPVPSGGGQAVGVMPVLQMAVALAIVLLVVKYALPWGIRTFGKRMTTPVDSPIRVQETAACGTSTLHVVTVRGRTLLIAAGPQGANLIADLTDVPPQPKTFSEMVEEAEPAQPPRPETPQQAAIEVEDPEPDPERLAEVLERLERLAG
ncbi:MAG: flagellar biosynthetic protein FliO [Fimbriimonadales bacterium]